MKPDITQECSPMNLNPMERDKLRATLGRTIVKLARRVAQIFKSLNLEWAGDDEGRSVPDAAAIVAFWMTLAENAMQNGGCASGRLGVLLWREERSSTVHFEVSFDLTEGGSVDFP